MLGVWPKGRNALVGRFAKEHGDANNGRAPIMIPRAKTRSIAGHSITLYAGVRYLATSPLGPPQHRPIDVTIHPLRGAPRTLGLTRIACLTPGRASRLVNAFNCGSTSFGGRVW